ERQVANLESTHAVTNTGRALHLVDGVDAGDLLDRRLAEEDFQLFFIGKFGVEDIVANRNIKAERRELSTRTAPFQQGGVIALVEIRHDDLFAIRRNARTTKDVAIGVAHGHHLATVRTGNGFADPAIAEVLV